MKNTDVKLPHGPGFQLVDAVISTETSPDTVIGSYTFTGEEEWRATDHFPGKPIMPGVMMIEAMAQNAIQIAQSKPGLEDKLFIFQGADKVKFLSQVTPYTTLTLSATIFWTEENRRGFANCMIVHDHRAIAEATIHFVVMKDRTKR